jgi:hypothetical protein
VTPLNPWAESAAPPSVRKRPNMSGKTWRGWLPGASISPGKTGPAEVGAGEPLAAPTGPVTPQPHVTMPEDTLPVRRTRSSASLWVVGAHGGSGESTMADLDENWQAAGHAWPELPSGAPAACVVVARTNVRGLLAARSALTQWAASGAGKSVCLLGLVLVADAPGKLPVPIRDLATVVGGGAPRVWEVPWVEAWRLGDPVTERVPRPVSQLVSELRSLSATATAAADPSHPTESS